MCNLGTAIENKGIETGIEIGEKKKAKELAIKLYKKEALWRPFQN